MPKEQTPILSYLSPGELKGLYLQYRQPLILWLIKSYQLEMEIATELAQQAFAIFVEKSTNHTLPVFEKESNQKSYLFAIAKNKAREWRRQVQHTSSLNESHLGIADESEVSGEAEKKEKIKIATKAFNQLGEKCQQLLRLAIVFKLSMQEIADQLQYENTNTAKNLKYKCLMRLRKLYTQSNQ